MPSFLKKLHEWHDEQQFFDRFGLDPIKWVVTSDIHPDRGEYFDPLHLKPGFLEARRVCSDNWRFGIEILSGHEYDTKRFSNYHTCPKHSR